jgi:subtilisin family serine protease
MKRYTHSSNLPAKIVIVFLFLVSICLPQAPVHSQDILIPPEITEAANPEIVAGRVIVKLRDNLEPSQDMAAASLNAAQRIQARGGIAAMRALYSHPPAYPELARQAGLEGVYILELQEGVDVFQEIQSLLADPNIEYAEPDYILRTAVTPDDTYYNQQWGLNNTGQTILGVPGKLDADIDLPEAWEITRGSRDIIIAIIDTGVDLTHPDLAIKLVPGYNFTEEGSPPQDDGGHGTHVAGTAAAATNNSRVGVAGVCWECRIMPVKALGTNSGTVATVASAITYAVDNGAHVINLSLGGPAGTTTLLNAIKYAYAANVPVVAAMMNEGNNTPYYPAAYPETIAIGSTDKQDVRSDFSCYGDHIDLSAPGEEILSTYWVTPIQHTYAWLGGTSMATPHISGVIGLIRSVAPQMGIEEIRSVLRNSADDLGTSGWDIYYGAGRLNANRALQLATHSIASLTISGPGSIRLGQPAAFTANVGPTSAQVPLTYKWEATGQTIKTATTNSLSNKATYTWTTTGRKTVKVTVTNAVNSIVTTKTVVVVKPVFLPAVSNHKK